MGRQRTQHGTIVPEFWNALEGVSYAARILAAWLLTGKDAVDLPGLIHCGAAGAGEKARLKERDARGALDELIAEGFAEYDEKCRVIRVPNAPCYHNPTNANWILGWYRRWQTMPNCALKAAHVDSLRSAIKPDAAPSIWAAWNATFGRETGKSKPPSDDPPNGSSHGSFNGSSHAPLHGPSNGPLDGPSKEEEVEDLDQAPERARGSSAAPLALVHEEPKPRKPRKPKPEPEPMPFTVAQLLEALAAGSGGKVSTSPCLEGHASRITGLIRELHASGIGLADVRLAGEFIGARWSEGFDIGPGWVASDGKLADTIAKARGWRDRGRPDRSGRPSASSSSSPVGEEDWRETHFLARRERKLLRAGITPPWWSEPARRRMTRDDAGEDLPPVTEVPRASA